MPIFPLFVFGAVLFGAGALLAPALPTSQPRIGLAAALALAIVVCGGVAASALDHWNSLLLDYLWFGLIVGIFLAGTLSAGMFKAEVEKREMGWPGPRELMMLLVIGILFAAPALTLPVPLDTDAQGFGYLALTMRDGGNITTLAPFHPEISYLYSPGFPMLVAYLSHQLSTGIQNIELALGAVFGFLFVWLAYDFGSEFDPEGGRRTGIVMALGALIGTGLLFADLDSHYSTLMALTFAMAFLTFAVRWAKHGTRVDFVAAAITLACVPLSHPDTTIILILGYVPWLLTMWLAKPRPTFKRWLGLVVGIPLLALLLLVPWLSRIAPLLGSSIQSPFTVSTSHLIVLTVYHGVVIVFLSLIGIVIGLRRRNPVDVLMIGWLALIIDFSSFGLLAHILPAALLKYDYPFSIAWHGPIIPYTYLGGVAILWLIDKIGRDRAEKWIIGLSLPILTVIAAVIVTYIGFKGQFVAVSKQTPLQIFGAFSSVDDVQAMEWIRQNADSGTLVLNHPGPQEGDWAPIITQHNAVYYRPQPFFSNTQQSDQMQHDLLAFWQNPAAPDNAALLSRYGVRYVLVPQIVARPDTVGPMFRWRPPSPDAILSVPLNNVPYLRLVYDSNGARVYLVIGGTAQVERF
jgi:MFS family permease